MRITQPTGFHSTTARRPGPRGRPRIRAVLAALLLVLGVGLSAQPAHAEDLLGYDISWPQCSPWRVPPNDADFVILGLTNGLAFTWNPCLQDQIAWARARGIPAHGYAMATYPTADQLAKHGGVGPWPNTTLVNRLRNVGYAEAADVIKELNLYAWSPPVVWIDVEPRPRQPWPSNTTNNRAVVVGLMRGLRDAGFGFGIYSYENGWKQIVGSWRLTGVPTWVPAGTLDYPGEVFDKCVLPSFSGGPVLLAQWVENNLDHDLTCPSYAMQSFTNSTFVDVSPFHGFRADIDWLAAQGISRGWALPEGTVEYRPGDPVAREAMAAFLYRFAGSPAYTPPATSPFVDVPVSNGFYKEIAWMAATGISRGWPLPGGRAEFRPQDPTSREAAAAFLYRAKGSPAFTPPARSPFVDVPTSSTFYREISWLAATGISRGWDVGGGRVEFRPRWDVSRDVMAVFLHRAAAVP